VNARTAAAVAVAAVAAAGPGHWRPLPPAPVAIDDGYTSVWTGSRMLVFGRVTSRASDGAVLSRRDAAASYDPGSNTWRRLPAPPASTSFMGRSSVWTGKEMLVWGQGIREAFDPATNRWRRLPSSPLLSIHDGYGLVMGKRQGRREPRRRAVLRQHRDRVARPIGRIGRSHDPRAHPPQRTVRDMVREQAAARSHETGDVVAELAKALRGFDRQLTVVARVPREVAKALEGKHQCPSPD